MQISQILQKGGAVLKSVDIPHPQLEAEILLLRAIVKTRLIASLPTMEWLIANPDFPINSETMKQFDSFLVRRSKFEPIAYITNHKEFYGYDFYADNRVLIPRPESEILVEQSLALLCHSRSPFCHSRENGNPGSGSPIVVGDDIAVLELGAGSGCIIISIIKELQRQKVNLSNFKFTATDISKDAIEVARKNARLHQVDQLIHFARSDLFDYFDSQMSGVKCQLSDVRCQMPGAKCQMFDLIIANLPYVPSYWLSDSPSEYGLIYEPKIALNGGKDGLDVYQRFFEEAPKYLAPNGSILVECEDDQVEKILKIIKNLNYKFSHQILIFKDDNNLQRTIQITATPGVD